MKKTYSKPVTDVNPILVEESLLAGTTPGLYGDIDGTDIGGGNPGTQEGGPGIPADVRKFDLWAEDDE